MFDAAGGSQVTIKNQIIQVVTVSNSQSITILQSRFVLISRMTTENVSNLSLHKVKQDILIAFHAGEILIPEDRSNVTKLL